jgi:UDP-glucuronate 4-epimerase
MKHYLLTGTAGFIAARVAELLLEGGHRVTGVDNMNDAYDVRVKEYRLARLENFPNFNFQRLDICDREGLEKLHERAFPDGGTFDAIINLAARAGVRQSVENPWVYVDTNLTGTLNLLELAKDHKTSKFILASTSSVYGSEAPLPTPEEASSDRPLQAYAASKKAAETLCHAYHYLYGTDVTVFRYFTVYGPAGRPDMVMFRFAKWLEEGEPLRINGDGEQSRGFTYVDDIAEGTLLGLRPLGYEIINLGGHESIKINELIRLFEEFTGKKAVAQYQPMHPADMLTNLASVEKARRLLGWEPKVALRDGVEKLVAWYREEQDWVSRVELQ